ncbi:MAG: hypothetical protein ABI488_14540 [Polyangiaceae bacterium]
MPSGWLNPAGGLRYHARALLGARAWAPFRAALAGWLSEFEPGVKRAVLVGPSAGYSFPDAFLQRFQALTLLEPDPVAGFLLKRRLRALGVTEVRLESQDLLIQPLLDGTSGLAELLRADPELCLIFGNVLGQTRFLCLEPEFERFQMAFRARLVPLLAGRAWLSFHDRLSGALSPHFHAPYRASARLDDAAVLRELYPSDQPGSSVELFDHHSGGFFPSTLPHAYFSWQIDRTHHHLIEAVRSSTAGA